MTKKQRKIDNPVFGRYRVLKYHCQDTNSSRYHQYGARGINLYPEWSMDFWSFARWINDNIGYPTSRDDFLERIDNDQGYVPGNLRWATAKESANNTQRNLFITIDGVTKTFSQWCDQEGILQTTALRRLNHVGLDPKYVFGFEPHPQCRPHKRVANTRGKSK
jgi:hypothetical protein